MFRTPFCISLAVVLMASLHAGRLFSQTPEEPPPPPGLPPHSVQDARHAGFTEACDIQFWRAITNQSTAHSLVVVTVVDTKTRARETYCTDGQFLLGAIMKEYKREHHGDALQKAIEMALKGRREGYSFRDPRAVDQIKPRYSAQDLVWAQGAIASLTNEAIVAGFSRCSPPSFYEDLYKNRPKTKGDLRYALAHAIYLRGLNVGLGCRTGNLWVTE